MAAMLQLKVKRFDTNLPLPAYKSPRAAALDLYARETVVVAPQSLVLVPLNVALQVPPNHWVLLVARSSLCKRGLLVANGVGVGDEDFCGDNDEYHAPIYNLTTAPVTIEKGDRIVQMIIMPREPVEITEVTHLNMADRGGFGSTGRK